MRKVSQQTVQQNLNKKLASLSNGSQPAKVEPWVPDGSYDAALTDAEIYENKYNKKYDGKLYSYYLEVEFQAKHPSEGMKTTKAFVRLTEPLFKQRRAGLEVRIVKVSNATAEDGKRIRPYASILNDGINGSAETSLEQMKLKLKEYFEAANDNVAADNVDNMSAKKVKKAYAKIA